jgi:hypothetical protein
MSGLSSKGDLRDCSVSPIKVPLRKGIVDKPSTVRTTVENEESNV